MTTPNVLTRREFIKYSVGSLFGLAIAFIPKIAISTEAEKKEFSVDEEGAEKQVIQRKNEWRSDSNILDPVEMHHHKTHNSESECLTSASSYRAVSLTRYAECRQ